MKITDKIDLDHIEYVARKIRSITHPVRISIIKLLYENEKLDTIQLLKELDLGSTEISFHLQLLRDNGILIRTKFVIATVYSLNREVLDNIIKVSEELSGS